MESTGSRAPRVGWLRQVFFRIGTFWPAKMAATSIGMTTFFVAYFWLLRHPFSPSITMPLTPLDRWIGFWPAALPLYLSLWFYVSLAPALLTDRRELISYGVAWIVLSVCGLVIFFFWPTRVPVPEIDWAQHPSFAFLKSVDASGNACPSLHVAFAVFSAIWFERLLRRFQAARWVRGLNWLWCAGILFSTVAVRQHVVLDVVAGIPLGAIVAALHLRWLRDDPGGLATKGAESAKNPI